MSFFTRSKLNVFMQGVALVALFVTTGCEVSGGYAVGIPVDATCEVPDADQISVVYQTSYVPAYLTVSINNDEFVFDECAPDEAQDGQGDFRVARGAETEIQIGLPHGSGLRQVYFPGGGDRPPYGSALSVKIMGRSSCSQMPTTLVPTTTLPIDWQSMSTGYGPCSQVGWVGSALIQ